MATGSRVKLSGSTDGRPFLVNVTTQATAITVHTAVSGTTSYDDIYVVVANTTASAATLNLLIDDGTIVDPDDYLCKAVSIPANSPPIPILTACTLHNASVLKAFASVNNALTLHGFVTRIA